LVGLLQGLERTPLRHPNRMLLQNPERTPVRKQDRQPLRHGDRMRVRAQEQHQEGPRFRLVERVLARGPVMRRERWLLQRRGQRLPPTLLSWPARRQDQGLLRGEGLPEPSRGWEKLGQCRSQKWRRAQVRSQRSRVKTQDGGGGRGAVLRILRTG